MRRCPTKTNTHGLVTLQLLALYEEQESVHRALAAMARDRYDRYARIMAHNKGLAAGVYATGSPIDVGAALDRYDESVARIVEGLKARAEAVERKLNEVRVGITYPVDLTVHQP